MTLVILSRLEGVLPSGTVWGPSGLGSAMISLVGRHPDWLLFVAELVANIH